MSELIAEENKYINLLSEDAPHSSSCNNITDEEGYGKYQTTCEESCRNSSPTIEDCNNWKLGLDTNYQTTFQHSNTDLSKARIAMDNIIATINKGLISQLIVTIVSKASTDPHNTMLLYYSDPLHASQEMTGKCEKYNIPYSASSNNIHGWDYKRLTNIQNNANMSYSIFRNVRNDTYNQSSSSSDTKHIIEKILVVDTLYDQKVPIAKDSDNNVGLFTNLNSSSMPGSSVVLSDGSKNYSNVLYNTKSNTVSSSIGPNQLGNHSLVSCMQECNATDNCTGVQYDQRPLGYQYACPLNGLENDPLLNNKKVKLDSSEKDVNNGINYYCDNYGVGVNTDRKLDKNVRGAPDTDTRKAILGVNIGKE